jgi:hypothetical protein
MYILSVIKKITKCVNYRIIFVQYMVWAQYATFTVFT